MAQKNRSKKKTNTRSVQKKKRKFTLPAAILGGVCLLIVVVWMLKSKNAALEQSEPSVHKQSVD
jgi:hypothetical protein